MKTKLIKQKIRIYRWEGFCDGEELPEITLGYTVIERQYRIFDNGEMKLDSTYPEKLLLINGVWMGCLWNEAILQEFFPGFTGYEVIHEQ